MAAPVMLDLLQHIEKRGVFGLNELRGTGVTSLLNGGIAKSDVDAQMILFFPFNQSVKLSSIAIDAPLEEAPTELRL